MQWQATVAKVANGGANEKEVLASLKSSGRTLADLEAAVARAKRIEELHAIVATLPAAAKKLQETAAAESEFNLERQREFARNRDDGIAIRTAALEARTNFDAIAEAQRELDGLIGTVEPPLVDAA